MEKIRVKGKRCRGTVFSFVETDKGVIMLSFTIRVMILLAVMLCSVCTTNADAIDNSRLIHDADGGNREAQYTLAHLFLKGRGGMAVDTSSAIGWFEKAAANGHRDASFDLAILYLEGGRVEKDDGQALVWMSSAAEQGHPEAQYYLGMAYRKSDPNKAVSWLKKANEGGHSKAGKDLVLLCEKEVDLCR
jgi:TPR repeat protein